MRIFLFLSLFLVLRAHAAPERVVSLGGDVTEIAFALGRGGVLAAVDVTSTYPEAARKLPQVGYVRALSAEGILAMKPDLVLASGDAGPPEALAQIKAAGVPVVVLPRDHTLEGIRSKITAVAEALGAAEEGAALGGAFDAERRELAAAVRAGDGPAAVFVMARGDGALIGAGRGTAADAMLGAAGLRNVLGDVSGYKPVSAEALVALAPTIVVTGDRTVQATGGLDRLRENPALRPAAGQVRHLLAFDDMYLLGLGPRAARAARELALVARK